jgi:hypothetical protein
MGDVSMAWFLAPEKTWDFAQNPTVGDFTGLV